MVRPEAEFDQGTGIGGRLCLPAAVFLITLHRSLRRTVPTAGRLTVEVVLTDQGLLNLAGARGIDIELASGRGFPRTLLSAGILLTAGGGARGGFVGLGL